MKSYVLLLYVQEGKDSNDPQSGQADMEGTAESPPPGGNKRKSTSGRKKAASNKAASAAETSKLGHVPKGKILSAHLVDVAARLNKCRLPCSPFSLITCEQNVEYWSEDIRTSCMHMREV